MVCSTFSGTRGGDRGRRLTRNAGSRVAHRATTVTFAMICCPVGTVAVSVTTPGATPDTSQRIAFGRAVASVVSDERHVVTLSFIRIAGLTTLTTNVPTSPTDSVRVVAVISHGAHATEQRGAEDDEPRRRALAHHRHCTPPDTVVSETLAPCRRPNHARDAAATNPQRSRAGQETSSRSVVAGRKPLDSSLKSVAPPSTRAVKLSM